MSDAAEPSRDITIRLLIFSGRPDPEWSPDERKARELHEKLVEAIGREPIHPPPPGGLGYRGFLVGLTNRGRRGREVVVFRNVLTEQEHERQAHWRDVTGVERWLLQEARNEGHGEILDAAGANGTDR